VLRDSGVHLVAAGRCQVTGAQAVAVIAFTIGLAVVAAYRLLHHTGDRHQPRSLAVTLPARQQTVPVTRTQGTPPWHSPGDGPATAAACPAPALPAGGHELTPAAATPWKPPPVTLLTFPPTTTPDPAPWINDLEAAGYDAHGGDLDAITESCYTRAQAAQVAALTEPEATP
jgi:hypothetical protein